MKKQKQKKFEIGTIQWLEMQAVEKRPEPFVIEDFLIFNDATVRFEITVKIIKETFATSVPNLTQKEKEE